MEKVNNSKYKLPEHNQCFEEKRHCANDFCFEILKHSLNNMITLNDILAHHHSAVEIIFMQQGNGNFFINDQNYDLKEQDILIISPNSIHSGKAVDDSVYQCILFSLNIFEIMQEDSFYKKYIPSLNDGSLDFTPFINSNNPDYQSLRQLIQLIINKNNLQDNNTFYIRGCFMQLINEIVNLGLIKNSNSIAYFKSVKSLKNTIDFMQKNYQRKISIEELAKISNFSQQYFCEYFKKNINVTPIEYLNKIRIRAASQLLLQTDKRIIDIAYDTGFNNFSYFSKVFNKIAGMNPTKYRSNFTHLKINT